eukprot:798555_1
METAAEMNESTNQNESINSTNDNVQDFPINDNGQEVILGEEETIPEEEDKKEEENTSYTDENDSIMKIFKKFKCSRIILSYLRLSHIVSLSFLSKSLYKTVNKYYGDCINLDLSEYYGVIGSPEFDHQSFMNDFLPKFKCVQSLSLRYCSHLKVVHLDNIIKALTLNNKNNKVNNESDNTNDNQQQKQNDDNIKNE